ncbi:MAG TPA: NDMA-dependent alcohol dehydrogenase [Acidimicrobiales bacterium]|nr:NDMA-dependent alcohol dehydrogenase [Acidimicrobiales bacterium]
MQTEAAVLWETGADWSIETVELDDPKAGEVRVKLAASGMCHSDEHLVTGDLPFELPIIGGHEGAGVVEEVGPGVTSLQVGDHVVFGFIPACGRCPSCSTGHQNLCDLGQFLATGKQIADLTSRHHANDRDLNLMCCLGTFAKYTVVNEASCIKIDDDIPLDKACLVGCGVTTGWGSAVYAAGVSPGDNVAVIGAGGIGMNAIQGAKLAGAERIFAIDPVEFKREQAQKFGATHTGTTAAESFDLVQGETWGRMCDKVIVTMGVGDGSQMAAIMGLVAKRGRAIITNITPWTEMSASLSMLDLTLMEKGLVGSLFGSANPRYDIPKLLELYRQGQLDLDGLVTRTYKLEDVNQGYADMRDGKNIRGVLIYE